MWLIGHSMREMMHFHVLLHLLPTMLHIYNLTKYCNIFWHVARRKQDRTIFLCVQAKTCFAAVVTQFFQSHLYQQLYYFDEA